MTVGEWIAARSVGAPDALRRRIAVVLGDDGSSDASATPKACLAGAERALRLLLRDRRFDRSGALDLLTVDALATYAFEYASEEMSTEQLDDAANRGMAVLGRITEANV